MGSRRRTWIVVGVWGVVLGVALACFDARAARSCTRAAPGFATFDWGSDEIPLEGVIVVFVGAGYVGLPFLHATISVTDATQTIVAGTTTEAVGSETTGDLIYWVADASLLPGATYEATLAYGGQSRTVTKVAALAATPPISAPTLQSLDLREAQRVAAECCVEQTDSCQPSCVTSRFDYVPALDARWTEPALGLDRRYLRYRWLIQQPDGSFAGNNATPTELVTDRATTLFPTTTLDSYCVVLEAYAVFDQATARSGVLCRDQSDIVTIDHVQPEAGVCPADPMTTPGDVDSAGGCRVGGAASPTWLVLILAGAARRRRSRRTR